MWVRLPPSPPDFTAFRPLETEGTFVAIEPSARIAQERLPPSPPDSTSHWLSGRAVACRAKGHGFESRMRRQTPGCSSAGRVLPSEGRRRWFESNHPDHSRRGSPIGRGSGLRRRSVWVRLPPPVPDTVAVAQGKSSAVRTRRRRFESSRRLHSGSKRRTRRDTEGWPNWNGTCLENRGLTGM